MKTPTERFEKKIAQYLDGKYSVQTPIETIALELYNRYSNHRTYAFNYETYLYIADLWKRGWFKKRYPNKRRGWREIERLEWEEILKNISEKENYYE